MSHLYVTISKKKPYTNVISIPETLQGSKKNTNGHPVKFKFLMNLQNQISTSTK